MTALVTKASPEVLAEIAALSERRLTKAEVEALTAIPISDDERAHTLALYRWFTRRYPTPAERLAYARRAYSAWAGRSLRG